MKYTSLLASVSGLILLVPDLAFSQQTNNSSTLNNQAAPSASSITSGGTNINYQTNNSFNNENGFAPGIFCRTPSLYAGGNWGQTNQNALDIASNTSSNYNGNLSANLGLVVPFGSSVLRECADLAKQITLDRKISTDLSLIRACSQLEKEGIVVDPQRFPYLEKCAKGGSSTVRISQPPAGLTPVVPAISPKTPRTTKS
jgi:hypothetical protein